MNELYEFYEAGADYVRTRMPFAPQIAVILGSSLGPFAGQLQDPVEIDYHEIPRDQALEQAKAEAIDMAVQAGAIRETVEIIEVEDVPLAYYPGNTNRVKIKAAGNLRG